MKVPARSSWGTFVLPVRGWRRIRAAVQDGDTRALENKAHALKSSVGNSASESAFQAVLKLETMGRNQKMAHAQEAMTDLEEKIRQLREQLLLMVEEPL